MRTGDRRRGAKANLVSTLSGDGRYVPALLHGWGVYKMARAGLPPRLQPLLGGRRFAECERLFLEDFEADWIHTGTGSAREWWDAAYREDGERFVVRSAGGKRCFVDAAYNAQAEVAVDGGAGGRESDGAFRFRSKSEIDDYFAGLGPPDEAALDEAFEHVRLLSSELGGDEFIVVNTGAPGLGVDGLTNEAALIAVIEDPELVSQCLLRNAERFLATARAAKRAGADAFIISESYLYSCDTISPSSFEAVMRSAHDCLYGGLEEIGLTGIGYFLGDANPLIPYISSLPLRGVMLEESKKGFVLDPVALRRRLRGDVCLFGNVDSALLLRGERDEIVRETRRQLEAAKGGPFAMINGSPVCLGTPAENLRVFLGTVRDHPAGAA